MTCTYIDRLRWIYPAEARWPRQDPLPDLARRRYRATGGQHGGGVRDGEDDWHQGTARSRPPDTGRIRRDAGRHRRRAAATLWTAPSGCLSTGSRLDPGRGGREAERQWNRFGDVHRGTDQRLRAVALRRSSTHLGRLERPGYVFGTEPSCLVDLDDLAAMPDADREILSGRNAVPMPNRSVAPRAPRGAMTEPMRWDLGALQDETELVIAVSERTASFGEWAQPPTSGPSPLTMSPPPPAGSPSTI